MERSAKDTAKVIITNALQGANGGDAPAENIAELYALMNDENDEILMTHVNALVNIFTRAQVQLINEREARLREEKEC